MCLRLFFLGIPESPVFSTRDETQKNFFVLGFVSGTIYMSESKSILKRVVFRVLVPVQNPKIALYLYILGIFHSPLISWY